MHVQAEDSLAEVGVLLGIVSKTMQNHDAFSARRRDRCVALGASQHLSCCVLTSEYTFTLLIAAQELSISCQIACLAQ